MGGGGQWEVTGVETDRGIRRETSRKRTVVIVKTRASAHVYNSCIWEVEAEISGGKGHLWLQSKFKASLDYMEPYLQKTKQKKSWKSKKNLNMEKNIYLEMGHGQVLHVQMYVYKHMHTCGGLRSMSGMFLSHPPPYLSVWIYGLCAGVCLSICVHSHVSERVCVRTTAHM